MRYEKIFLIGADHSWHKQISVSSDKLVCIREEYFYDKASPQESVYYNDGQETQPFRIHELFQMWADVFSKYHDLNRYASHLGARIYNASSKLYIDAFERICY